jgi:micrococcal nuclease
MRSNFRLPRRVRMPSVGAIVVIIIVALLRSGCFSDSGESSGSSEKPAALAEGLYKVQRVVDGDTLLLANKARIRLIGADTPDTPETVKPNHPVEPWGPEATEFTKRFVGNGTVRLVFDHERIDRYGRFLAYVYVDDQMLNEQLIRAGLADARTKFRYSSSAKRLFRDAEQEARGARRGIWSDSR